MELEKWIFSRTVKYIYVIGCVGFGASVHCAVVGSKENVPL